MVRLKQVATLFSEICLGFQHCLGYAFSFYENDGVGQELERFFFRKVFLEWKKVDTNAIHSNFQYCSLLKESWFSGVLSILSIAAGRLYVRCKRRFSDMHAIRTRPSSLEIYTGTRLASRLCIGAIFVCSGIISCRGRGGVEHKCVLRRRTLSTFVPLLCCVHHLLG